MTGHLGQCRTKGGSGWRKVERCWKPIVTGIWGLVAALVAVAPASADVLSPASKAPQAIVAATTAETVPGATTSVKIAKSAMSIRAWGYDVLASKLFVLIKGGGGTFKFGTLEPETGKFSPMGAPIKLKDDFWNWKKGLTIQPSNGYTKSPAHAILHRDDGLIVVDLSTKGIVRRPTPEPWPLGMTYDPTSSMIYGFGHSGNTIALDPTTSRSSVLTKLNFGSPNQFSEADRFAIDPYRHIAYMTTISYDSFETSDLIAFSTATGAVSERRLPRRMYGLGFDVSTGLETSALYGLEYLFIGNQPVFRVVKVSSSGATKPVIVVGKNDYNFGGSDLYIAGDLDPANRLVAYFVVRTGDVYTSTLVTSAAIANRSWYVNALASDSAAKINSWMKRAGIALGTRDIAGPTPQPNHVILDFFGPKRVSSAAGWIYGATGQSRFMSVAEIRASVMSYARGYNQSTGGKRSLVIVVGTNNSTSLMTAVPPDVAGIRAHGAAWAGMVRGIRADLAAAGLSRISVLGGMDIEQGTGWSGPAAIRAWKAGYGTDYANFGSAFAGIGGWTMNDLVELAGKYVFPEIYFANGADARNFAKLSKAKKQLSGAALNIVVPLSQIGSCSQTKACGTTDANRSDNTPMAAWLNLSKELNALGISPNAVRPGTDIAYRLASSQAPVIGVAAAESFAKRVVPATELGLRDDYEPIAVRGRFNAWDGYIEGRLYTAAAGSAAGKPMQGLVIVTDETDVVGKVYPTPAAAGPVAIIGEKDGILTLRTVAGTFEQYSLADGEVVFGKPAKVTTTGGKIFRFDIRARRFL